MLGLKSRISGSSRKYAKATQHACSINRFYTSYDISSTWGFRILYPNIRCKSEQVDSKMETNCFIIHPFHTYGRQISAYRKFPHIKKGTWNRNIRLLRLQIFDLIRFHRTKKALYSAGHWHTKMKLKRKWLFISISKTGWNNWVIITTWSYSLNIKFINPLSFDELNCAHVQKTPLNKFAFAILNRIKETGAIRHHQHTSFLH